jgi:mannose-6-phosphate isomerase-like protein (cupin superfamily)
MDGGATWACTFRNAEKYSRTMPWFGLAQRGETCASKSNLATRADIALFRRTRPRPRSGNKDSQVFRTFRRVVTGHNDAGRSIFIIDGEAAKTFDRGPGTTHVTDIWETGQTPADNSSNADSTVGPYNLPPPKNGAVFRMLEIPPDSERKAALRDSAKSFETQSEGYRRDFGNARHPGFHKTASTDYVIVLSGEIYALVDEGETLLKPGDVFVQRGTSHAWSNRGSEPAVLAVVLIDAVPVAGA